MSLPDTSAPASVPSAPSVSVPVSSLSDPLSASVSAPSLPVSASVFPSAPSFPSSVSVFPSALPLSFPVSASESEVSVPPPFPSASPASASFFVSGVSVLSAFWLPASEFLLSPPAVSASFLPLSFPAVSVFSCTVFTVPVLFSSARTAIAAPSCSTIMDASRKLSILACHFCFLNIFSPPLYIFLFCHFPVMHFYYDYSTKIRQNFRVSSNGSFLAPKIFFEVKIWSLEDTL